MVMDGNVYQPPMVPGVEPQIEKKERERKAEDFFGPARENFLRALDAAGGTLSSDLVRGYCQPEIDLLTPPENWDDLTYDEKRKVARVKEQEYEQSYGLRQQNRPGLGGLNSGLADKLLHNMGLNNAYYMAGVAEVLYHLQAQADETGSVYSCNVQNFSGKQDGQWRSRNINLADYRSPAFQGVFGIDIENGQKIPGYEDKTDYPTALPNVTFSIKHSHKGDTAHETYLTNLTYEHQEEEEVPVGGEEIN